MFGIKRRAYLLEFKRAEPPSIKRIPEFVEFCRATERDSSYVVPPTMKITTSCGLYMTNNKGCFSCMNCLSTIIFLSRFQLIFNPKMWLASVVELISKPKF